MAITKEILLTLAGSRVERLATSGDASTSTNNEPSNLSEIVSLDHSESEPKNKGVSIEEGYDVLKRSRGVQFPLARLKK